MKYKILPLFFAILKIVLANEEIHESPGKGRCNAFFRCPLKDEYAELGKTIPEGERLDEKYYKCCSFYGRCGETDEHCGVGCQNGDCLPGAAATTNNLILCSSFKLTGRCDEDCTCPYGQCCSKYGFCGTGDFYCGSGSNKTTKKKTILKKISTNYNNNYNNYNNIYTKKTSTKTRRTSTKRITVTVTSTVTTKKTSEPTPYTSSERPSYPAKADDDVEIQAIPPAKNAGVVVYLPYYGLYNRLNLMKFDFTGIDVVNYSFLRIDDSGNPYSSDTDLENSWKGIGVIPYLNTVVKKKYPHLKTIISIGGASGSKNFKTFLKNSRTLKYAATNIVKFCNKHGFDGIDIDWEFPANAAESGYYLNFITEIRKQLGKKKLLTLAVAAKPKKYHGYVTKFADKFNWINFMTYDYTGDWNKYSGFNAPLYHTPGDKNDQFDGDQSIKEYIDQGVPASKLCLGGAFYGRTWKVTSKANNGYNQRGNGNIKGQESDVKSNGKYAASWSYYALRTENVLSSKKSAVSPWKRAWHNEAKSPSLLNTKDLRFISYDDVDSMRERVKYCKKMGLAGFMIWEVTQDYKRELIKTIIDEYNK